MRVPAPTFRLSARLACLAALALAGCATSPAPARSGAVEHVVLVWLKRPGNAADRQAILDASAELRAIPGVREVVAGTPPPAGRPLVDASFDVGVVMKFDSRQDMEAYLRDPLHVRKVHDTLLPLARKVRIHDIVVP